MTSRWMLFITILFLIPGKYNTVSGQRFQNIMQAEDTLSAILDSLNLAGNDSSRSLINQKFSVALLDALKLPSSDNYPFDSLKTLVKIASPDDKFRILHWNLPSGNGKHRYFGFLKLTGGGQQAIYPLVDFSDSIPFPDTAILDNSHWPGALYYKVIPGETATGSKIYTLLGWAGKNQSITHKVIEILHFDAQERPHFGLKVFPGYQGGEMTRVIFRFSATTTMSVKYEKKTIASNKRWNGKKREFEYDMTEERMIVFDRMVPLDPQLAGQYQFYVAEGDISDGFLFDEYHWKFIAGIVSGIKE